jgi:hypothetical protein
MVEKSEPAVSALADLFPAGDYRFHLTLRRGDPREFFRPGDATGRVLAERRRWIAEAPARYTAMRPVARAAFEEFVRLCNAWGGRKVGSIQDLGGELEPDVLFLVPDENGRFRLQAGALCFPTGWALEEKMGHPLEAIHGVVPGLNNAIGDAIQQFLEKLKPSVGYLRDNWGLAATDALNLHPTVLAPTLEPPLSLDRVWLRVESQILVALPESRAIVFGIRIRLSRLDEVALDREATAGLVRALASMPEEMARYKRLDTARAELVRLLS